MNKPENVFLDQEVKPDILVEDCNALTNKPENVFRVLVEEVVVELVIHVLLVPEVPPLPRVLGVRLLPRVLEGLLVRRPQKVPLLELLPPEELPPEELPLENLLADLLADPLEANLPKTDLQDKLIYD